MVGEIRGLGLANVDDDHRAVIVGGDCFEYSPGLVEAMAVPRVLSEKDRHFSLGELPMSMGAVHAALNPCLARLLLGEGVGLASNAKQRSKGRAVDADEVVALAATAVVHDLVATVGISHVEQGLGNLIDCGLPIDLDVAAITEAFHRAREASRSILIVVQAQRLLTGISLRGNMALVAADSGDLTRV